VTKLVENDLEFDFSDAMSAIQFDDDGTHGNSSMKRVDFIAEYEECYRFIEVKDPDIPDAKNCDGFLEKFQSGNLISNLAGKYRDSILFRVLSNKADKEFDYIVLLSMSSLEPALLLNKQDDLHRSIPHNHSQWNLPCARNCVILNLEQYKNQFGENSVRRLSASGA
jgi:hypothetical protein